MSVVCALAGISSTTYCVDLEFMWQPWSSGDSFAGIAILSDWKVAYGKQGGCYSCGSDWNLLFGKMKKKGWLVEKVS